jgi:hypothetical protein
MIDRLFADVATAAEVDADQRDGADSRCYQATVWARGHRGPAASVMLDWLPSEARRWRVPPGSEEPSEQLPAAPGWRGAA